MRASTVFTLFFSFFCAVGVAFCLPSPLPASIYAPGNRDIPNKHIAAPADLFLRGLGQLSMREIQLQIRDYCLKFPCGEAIGKI
ncbi:hypothetical protein AZE42_07648 [Rhizopogon vesiculosus]|uniref:Uncharacterized protein n=1 Tax=Rhizopogon vesiculosus TaxID=180088 RepID=A0A1J8QE76_9AGAM|nr:hypothetical protein AZE42_07648 [Rhizopogon vesiculosus]